MPHNLNTVVREVLKNEDNINLIYADKANMKRIVSYLQTKKSTHIVQYFGEGEYMIIVDDSIDYSRIREKLRDIDFRTEFDS